MNFTLDFSQNFSPISLLHIPLILISGFICGPKSETYMATMLKCPGNIFDQEHYTNLSPMLWDPFSQNIVPMFLASCWHKVLPSFHEPWLGVLSTMMASWKFIYLFYFSLHILDVIIQPNLFFITVMYTQVIEVYYGNVNKWKGNRVSKGEGGEGDDDGRRQEMQWDFRKFWTSSDVSLT